MVPINAPRLRGIRGTNGAVFPGGVTGVTYGARWGFRVVTKIHLHLPTHKSAGIQATPHPT
jgi:hypothetical protein